MIRLASVIETFEADFLERYKGHIRSEHLQALSAIKQCRTQASPKMLTRCTDAHCAHQRLVPHSCGHRHCPHCQHHESQQWLERQLKKQVPAEYFLITFTVPAQFRALAAAEPKRFYDLLLACSWETVRTFSRNDKQLAGEAGAIAVLHTHTRRLDYHPHVHLVMPAGAIDVQARRWRTKRPRKKSSTTYLFNHEALAIVFRAKLLAGLEAAGLRLPKAYPKDWVVDCKSVGDGQSALIYLGRYLYRGVIREQDIVSCADGKVSFRYRDAQSGQRMLRTVSGAEFLWLVLQHVLPKGFRRARNFGFLHPNCKRLIALLQVLLRFIPILATACVKPRPAVLCPCCGAAMKIVKTRIPAWEPPRTPPSVHNARATSAR
jgi:hypothetical protein